MTTRNDDVHNTIAGGRSGFATEQLLENIDLEWPPPRSEVKIDAADAADADAASCLLGSLI
ncbi:hypothetical protein [Trichothermofontia sp.]